MEVYNKLEKLINKYLYECTEKKIKIMTPDPNDELVKLILGNYKEASVLKEQKINDSCIVILLQPIDKKIIELINKTIDQNIIFIGIVLLDFDFDNLIKNVKANSIDADYWRKDGERYKKYIVTIKRD